MRETHEYHQNRIRWRQDHVAFLTDETRRLQALLRQAQDQLTDAELDYADDKQTEDNEDK